LKATLPSSKFAGSESYWPSSAETFFVVDPTTEPAQTPDFPPQIDNTMTIVGVGIAILIVIAVVGPDTADAQEAVS